MRILFAARHSGYLRRFDDALRELHARGHEIAIVLGVRAESKNEDAEELAAELERLERVTVLDAVVGDEHASDLAPRLRAWMNHLRYLEPTLDLAGSRLHERMARALPATLVEADLVATSLDPRYPARQRALLADVERRLPPDGRAREQIEEIGPDAVVVTPLIERGEPQLSYLRAARQLGIPRGVLVASWDNMTTGGLLHDVPDRLLVWNAAQRREAIRLMNVPKENVVITGASTFDRWFGRAPSRDRAAFSAAAGLLDARPYVLYLGSSAFIAPDEGRFVLRWLQRIRGSNDDRLRHVNVVVRSHPFHALTDDAELVDYVDTDERTVFYPRQPTSVVSDPARADYFDALHHAAVVVGINTSGLIEAAIAGRPVAVPGPGRYRASQELSPHFQHLVEAGRGLFEPERLRRHVARLAELVDNGPEPADAVRRENFLRSFVRPSGRGEPAAPHVATAIEELAALPVDAVAPPTPPDPAALATLSRAFRGRGWRPRARSDREPVGAPAVALELEAVIEARRRAPILVHQPLVLIGQIQRSGGTLLNTLLDGHPMLHVHPHELHIGHPRKDVWPALDLTTKPRRWLEVLAEERLGKMLATGYFKSRQDLRESALPGYEPLPFLLPPSLLRTLFFQLARDRPPASQRDVLDLYFSAYFTAWLNGHSRVGVPARWVVGFCPRLGWSPSRAAFFGDYPDGRLIMVVRDPRAWYASATEHAKNNGAYRDEYSDFDRAMSVWTRNVDEATGAKRERPDAVLVVTYEALVTRTEETMRSIANWLAIGWDPILLEPTFNREPVSANTSFEAAAPGVRPEPSERWRTALAPEVVASIEERALAAYDLVRGDVREVSRVAG